MHEFITGLQFLTRIKVTNQSEWLPDSFGRSVKFFPLIGAVIGMLLVAINYIIDCYLPELGIYCPPHVLATILTAAPILITGGLHCDGFMDTMDGIFSGRSRERKLEIMKDSRVGANGVTAFTLLILLKWSLLTDIAPSVLPLALFSMPVLGRFAMVIGITVFPYARPDGMGKAFAQHAGRTTLVIAALLTLILIIPLGKLALLGGVAVIVFALLFAKYATKMLGGLTGDVYGAMTELAEILVLVTFLL
ncbi:Adenosylcobinamide-GDP ribazoletransferase [bioreactor metagenome]|uniref:Adenosylcobinamide-GDP ribazoletransferase n=1 Tax=bioreactor metagenome TaxID=1076179 RepID=A0A644T2M4_9ZZZZ|nr:adenosylcobinamide-GDP ribazoletransferase [Negativicutes bacterium]